MPARPPGDEGLLEGRGGDPAGAARRLALHGDLAFVDDEGFLHYVDRLKDVIKHEGHSIAPAGFERP